MLVFEVIISVLTMYPSILILMRENVKTKKVLIDICILIVSGILLMSIKRTLGPVLVIFMMILVYRRKKNIKFAVLSAGIAYVLNTFLSEVVFLIHIELIGVEITTKNMIFMYICILILMYISSAFASKVINFEWLDLKKESKLLNLLIGILGIYFIAYLLNNIFNYSNFSSEDITIFTFLLLLMMFLFIGFIVLSFKNIYKEKEFENKKQEMEILQKHIMEVDKSYSEIRRFKHDYLNMMSSMEVHLQNRDFEKLDEFFKENIKLVDKSLNSNITKFAALERIEIDELKSLLRVKLSQALDKNLNVEIEVEEVIEKFDWNPLEMSRVIGILFDNGIEAIEKIDGGEFRIAILKMKKEIVFIFSNNFEGEVPSIQKIYKEGFSTKGDSRGLGLATVKELIDRNKNIMLETKINNGRFTQIIKVSER